MSSHEIDPTDPAVADIIGEPMRQEMLRFRAQYPHLKAFENWTVRASTSAREVLSERYGASTAEAVVNMAASLLQATGRHRELPSEAEVLAMYRRATEEP